MKVVQFKSKNEEDLRKEIEKYALKVGIKVNPDEKIVQELIKGL